MTGALGARCHTCHVGEPGPSLEGYDFASDDKEQKQIAREMIKMVRQINAELLPAAVPDRARPLQVACVTCHHGVNRPQTLVDTLAGVLENDGLDAAVEHYRELREKYYGRAAYDFSEWRLINLAERLVGEAKVDAARRFLELNAEVYPEFGKSFYDLGELDQQAATKSRPWPTIARPRSSRRNSPSGSSG